MEGKKSLICVVRMPSGRGSVLRINQMHFILTGPPPPPLLPDRIFIHVLAAGMPELSNSTPFDMSVRQVRYPMPFFIEKEEVLNMSD